MGKDGRKKEIRTLHGLLRVKVIRHTLDPRVQLHDLPNDDRQVLQDEPARRVGVLPPELVQVVAQAAADVDDQRGIGTSVDALNEALLDRVEALVHPRRPALPVAAHVVVELDAAGRVRLQVLKHVELGVVGVLHRAVGDAVGGLVAVLACVFGEFVQGRGEGSGAGGRVD